MPGLLIVLSGPSAAGKGTVCRRFVEDTNTALSVSATTRLPRAGEINGKDYFFMTEEEFVRIIEEDGFVEHVENFGKRYGTLYSHVKDKLESGEDMILEIDVQGGELIRKKFPQCVLIFLLPPSLKELRRRLESRGTESKENIETRLAKSVEEIECITKYDYYIVNEDVEQAVEDMKAIVRAGHLKLNTEIAESIISRYNEEENNNAVSGN